MTRLIRELALGYAVLWLAVTALGFSGCATLARYYIGGERLCPESYVAARDHIWVHAWQRREDPPELACVEPGKQSRPCSRASGRIGFVGPSGECISGLTAPGWSRGGRAGSMTVMVGTPVTESALAHELVHVRWFADGMPLPHHSEGSFKAPAERENEFFAEVERTRMLMTEGGF